MGRGRNRRRIDRAAQAAAAGVRARRAGKLLLGLGLAAAAALAVRAAWREATTGAALRIRAVRFQGLARAGAEELLELSPVKAGDNLLRADLDAVEAALRRHPWLAEVRVERRFRPPALEVAVRERVAAALVDLGGLYLVDREGGVFKRAEPGDGLDLPLVTGFARDDYVQRRAEVEPLLGGALRLLDDWAAAGLARALPVSEIHLDGTDGVTVYAGEEGLQVRLGGGDAGPKLARLGRVLEALRAEGRRAEVIHLDDRAHPSWVTVRPRLAAGNRGPRGP